MDTLQLEDKDNLGCNLPLPIIQKWEASCSLPAEEG